MTESISESPWRERASRVGVSPPTPPGSVWQPAPPFQCLGAFGAPQTSARPVHADVSRYHSLGRPQPTSAGGGVRKCEIITLLIYVTYILVDIIKIINSCKRCLVIKLFIRYIRYSFKRRLFI